VGRGVPGSLVGKFHSLSLTRSSMTDSIATSSARRSTEARSLPVVVARFMRTEVSGGIALVAAAAVALVWANSPWHASYESLWHSQVDIRFGPFQVEEDLRHFVNDALMALFFFVVGLEIKREAVHGELADRRVAALPILAAIGGMAVPAAVYAVIALGSDVTDGWGIPMATDIAFALGVLALLGTRAPPTLKLFLLTLAIVDDIGAIVVIALFYSDTIDTTALLAAVAGVLACVLLRRQRIDWSPIYVALAIAIWYATYRSGVHATIAGVALALTIPTQRLAPAALARRWAQDLSDEPTASEVHQMTIIARESVSPAEHLEELLHPTTSFVVLPLFALANAGVELRSGMLSANGATTVAAGVALGLVVGKLTGILAGAWLGTKLRIAVLPTDVSWRHLSGAAALGGIGFTVSLFITDLAFTDHPQLIDAAKLAILVASVAAAILGAAILFTNGTRSRPPRPDVDARRAKTS
jgi:NhaA family Na+:H+ antiporter